MKESWYKKYRKKLNDATSIEEINEILQEVFEEGVRYAHKCRDIVIPDWDGFYE